MELSRYTRSHLDSLTKNFNAQYILYIHLTKRTFICLTHNFRGKSIRITFFAWKYRENYKDISPGILANSGSFEVYQSLSNKPLVITNKPGTAKVGAISKAQNLKRGPFGLCETPAGCKKFLKK